MLGVFRKHSLMSFAQQGHDDLLIKNLLSVKNTIEDNSFTVAASIFLNALPFQIKNARIIDSFKSLIKIHIFKTITVA